MKTIHESVWVAPSAELYGRIEIGEGSSLWPQCVIRAECQHVRIGRNTNLQDFVMIHVGYDDPTHDRRLLLDHAPRGACTARPSKTTA